MHATLGRAALYAAQELTDMSMYDRIEAMNYERDARNCDLAEIPVVTINGEDVRLPWHWVVCNVCRGRGTHVNPAIDCNGLTSDDFAEDPDFAEEYFNGAYDQTCNYCGGRTTVPDVDFDALTEEQEAAWEAQAKAERAMDYERMAERAFGC